MSAVLPPPGCKAPEVNPRGIPGSPFVESVKDFVASEESVDAALKRLNQQYTQYKALEEKIVISRSKLALKIPEIEKTLSAIKWLEEKKDSEEPIKSRFEIADHVFANGIIKKPTHVSLWLGADVMVEFPIAEARQLLENQLTTARLNQTNGEEDLKFLRSQITISEVNIARIYNYDVKQRRKTNELSVKK